MRSLTREDSEKLQAGDLVGVVKGDRICQGSVVRQAGEWVIVSVDWEWAIEYPVQGYQTFFRHGGPAELTFDRLSLCAWDDEAKARVAEQRLEDVDCVVLDGESMHGWSNWRQEQCNAAITAGRVS